MNIIQNLVERLRPLVGAKGWDYCVLWKLSDDQRFLEWMDSFCAGTEHTTEIIIGGDQNHQFSVSPVLPCRDILSPHPRSKSCDLLAQLPSSMPLDSAGIHAQTLISNQARWLMIAPNSSDSNVLLVAVGTRVLIPVAGGLIELFASKQVPEDQNVVDFVITQYNISLEQHLSSPMVNSSAGSMDTKFSVLNVNALNNGIDHNNEPKDPNNVFQPPVSPATALENLNLSYDISASDRILACSSPMNFLQQYCFGGSEIKTKDDAFFEGSHDLFLSDKTVNPFNPLAENSVAHEMDPLQNSMLTSDTNIHVQGNNNDKDENARSDSVLSDCSDQVDDEDDPRYRRRMGSKGPQSKNLVAERKRRKKLNDRLYALRSLVPKISKLDKASILGDAIDFVKELQKQAKELQDELEEHSDTDDEGAKNTVISSYIQPESLAQNGIAIEPKSESESRVANAFHGAGASGNGCSVSLSKQNQDPEDTTDKAQQMEVQVEVTQVDGNKFFVKVFCEHKPGGFVRLMEVLDSLGLEVTNANVTSCRGLVSNVFKVEKKDSEVVQADHVRESLLELTRNPSWGWSDMEKASGANNGVDYHQQHQHHFHSHNHHMSSHHHHLHHFHN